MRLTPLVVLLSPAASRSMRALPVVSRRTTCGLLAAVASPGSAYAQERVGADGRIVLDNPPTIDVLAAPPKVSSRCYLDVSVAGRPAGRIVICVSLDPLRIGSSLCLSSGFCGHWLLLGSSAIAEA